MTCFMAMIGDGACDQDGLELIDKINNLLDCVERPVGTLKAHIPPTADSERALIALYDAIGRTL